MTVFVDTSVWSLAFRRDVLPDLPEIDKLRLSLDAGNVYCTGVVLQELLQGFAKPKAHKQIIRRFSSIPLLVADRDDYIQAAEWRNKCRRNGVQAGTIDALLAQLCIRYELTMLTLDHDFHHMADIIPLSLWQAEPDESRKL